MVRERFLMPSESSRVLVEDLHLSSAKRQKSMSTEGALFLRYGLINWIELVNWVKMRSTISPTSLATLLETVSLPGSWTDKEILRMELPFNLLPTPSIPSSEKILKEWRRSDATEVLDTSGDSRSEVNTLNLLVEEVLQSVSSRRRSKKNEHRNQNSLWESQQLTKEDTIFNRIGSFSTSFYWKRLVYNSKIYTLLCGLIR